MRPDLTNSEFKLMKVIYQFRHSRMGFENQVTVTARNEEEAITAAKNEISAAYGSKMLPRFTFKNLTA